MVVDVIRVMRGHGVVVHGGSGGMLQTCREV